MGEAAKYDDFLKLDLRVGTVREVDDFPEARKPAWKLTIDFGSEIGIRRSSAQITHHYDADTLLGRQIIAVVNFPPKRIAGFSSEVLVLGLSDRDGHIILIGPDRNVEEGERLQ